MQEILNRLHKDHINFAKVLKVFESQLVDIRNDNVPDYALILSALEYLMEYLDVSHHPTEDAIYQTYLNRHSESTGVVQGLMLEHKALTFLTAKLVEIMNHMVQGNLRYINVLDVQLSEFIGRQINHINAEENTIFQIMDQTLTEKEWSQLTSKFLPMNDPLFDLPVDSRYKKLSAFIDKIS